MAAGNFGRMWMAAAGFGRMSLDPGGLSGNDQRTDQPSDQRTDQPTNGSTNQQINQPTNQPNNLPDRKTLLGSKAPHESFRNVLPSAALTNVQVLPYEESLAPRQEPAGVRKLLRLLQHQLSPNTANTNSVLEGARCEACASLL